MSRVSQRADADRGTACWLPELRRRPHVDARLFCFPHAGGAVSTFATWPEQLPARLDVRPVHLPGRGTRHHEPPITRASSIIAALATALIPLLDRPFAMFGHSMGALLAFETARLLRRHGLGHPACLIVSGRRAPHLADVDLPSPGAPDHSIIAWLREKNGTPGEVLEDPALMTLVLPVLRADLLVCRTYEYVDEPPLACPILALGGRDDEEGRADRLEAWQRHTTGRCTVLRFPGDHFYLRSAEPHLLKALRRALVSALPTLAKP
jgi:medium-chain acyl-[acyl-carrier-protein] hydrolase